APLWAVWHVAGSDGLPPARSAWALGAMRRELGKGFFHVLWAPALLGLWWWRGRFREAPGAWAVLVLAVLWAGLLYWAARSLGYLSARHAALFLLLALYWS